MNTIERVGRLTTSVLTSFTAVLIRVPEVAFAESRAYPAPQANDECNKDLMSSRTIKRARVFGSLRTQVFTVLLIAALPQQALAFDSDCKSAQLADVNNDDLVSFADVNAVLAEWGAPKPSNSDTNRNGEVNFGDIFSIVRSFGSVSERCADAIELCEDLHLIRNDLSADYILTCDINLEGAAFQPIGSFEQPFSGTLNGQGFSILNFTHSSNGQDKVGLFGSIIGGVVRNLNVENAEVSIANANDAGILAGFTNSALIENCTSSGTVGVTWQYNNSERIGGLIGHIDPGSIIRNSSSSVAVLGGLRVGGLAGVNHGSLIENCSASGDVTGIARIGGLLGYTFPDQNDGNSTTTRNSVATGNVNGGNPCDYAGGFIGYHLDGVIENSSAHGHVSETRNYSGGFVGRAESSVGAPSIINSHATGTVMSAENYVGGFAGWFESSGAIENCYATGAVQGNWYVGGFAGQVDQSLIANSFATGNAMGSIYVGGLLGSSGFSADDVGATISSCYSTGNALGDGTPSIVGGLIGFSSVGTHIQDSYSLGNASGNANTGGLLGQVRGTTVERSFSAGLVEIVEPVPMGGFGGFMGFVFEYENEEPTSILDSYAHSDLLGSGPNVGGFIGKVASDVSIVNSYSTASGLENSLPAGGFIGALGYSSTPNITVTNSYWDSDRAGIAETIAGEPRTTAEMTSVPRPPDTYVNWNFDNTWQQTHGEYPTLQTLLAGE